MPEGDVPGAFVDREKMLDAVAQMLRDMGCVIGKCLRGVARSPAAEAIPKRLGQVPMIQGYEWLDAVRRQLVQQPVIEIEALWVWRTCSFRENARPSNRKTIGFCAQRLHQLNVFLVKMIMIGRGVGVAVIRDGPARVGETVPNRWAAAVFVDGPLDLIG